MEKQTIPVKAITVDPAFNSRVNSGLDKEEIQKLSQSIEENGLLNPVVVVPTKNGFFLVNGFRRLAAIQLLKRDTIDASVMAPGAKDEDLRILNLVENYHREDLSMYELARACCNLRDAHKMSANAIIKRLDLNLAKSTIGNLMRVYDKLDKKILAVWADPKNPANPLLTMRNLIEIVSKEDQRAAFLELQGMVDPDASDKEGKEKSKGKGSKGMLKRDKVEAALHALLRTAGIGESAKEGAESALRFVLRMKGAAKFQIGTKVIFDPKPPKAVKETKSKEAKETEKDAA